MVIETPKQLTLFDDETKSKTDHIAKSYTGIYSMHKYWSKKPYNIIQDFILRYTNKDEIVVDPFCGSGISMNLFLQEEKQLEWI